ncbi:MAG: hypothetical protein H7224_03055 [Polaromonas sp.]|nr:hypothetical protein [Polaromonas sp.]
MSPANELWMTVVSATLGVAMACWALSVSRRAWRMHQRPQDMAMQVTAGVWLLQLVTVTSLQTAAGVQPFIGAAAHYVEQVGLQAIVVSLGFFMLSTAGVTRSGVYLLLVALGLLGLAALHWQPWLLVETFARFSRSSVYPVWISINLLAGALVTLAVARQVNKTHSQASWLALSACLLGLGWCVEQLILGAAGQRVGLIVHPMYALLLLVVWRMSSRVGGGASSGGTASEFSPDFPRSVNMDLVSDFGPAGDAAAVAVAHERRRIGQDLHDGVASQLVNILSSLDVKTPHQQAVALAIEQCLVDLRMTVDALDSGNDSVLDALGRLRYRVQHSLDKLGVRMSWRVELRDELEAVRGEAAQHALRIAQEALANVMLHAQASAVEVVCRFVPESSMMVLEVRDNGRGIPRRTEDRAAQSGGQRSGKGLASMRQRAKTLGGDLSVSSKQGAGTRVRLTLPLETLQDRHKPGKNVEDSTLAMHETAAFYGVNGLDGVTPMHPVQLTPEKNSMATTVV